MIFKIVAVEQKESNGREYLVVDVAQTRDKDNVLVRPKGGTRIFLPHIASDPVVVGDRIRLEAEA